MSPSAQVCCAGSLTQPMTMLARCPRKPVLVSTFTGCPPQPTNQLNCAADGCSGGVNVNQPPGGGPVIIVVGRPPNSPWPPGGIKINIRPVGLRDGPLLTFLFFLVGGKPVPDAAHLLCPIPAGYLQRGLQHARGGAQPVLLDLRAQLPQPTKPTRGALHAAGADVRLGLPVP